MDLIDHVQRNGLSRSGDKNMQHTSSAASVREKTGFKRRKKSKWFLRLENLNDGFKCRKTCKQPPRRKVSNLLYCKKIGKRLLAWKIMKAALRAGKREPVSSVR